MKQGLYQAGFKAGFNAGSDKMLPFVLDLTLKSVILSLYRNGFCFEDVQTICDDIYDVVMHYTEKKEDVEEDINTIEEEWGVKFLTSSEKN